ncbi:UNVERIFIED_CONTAM: hypothetical protein FKN15_026930 [Acipenser sinensis]
MGVRGMLILLLAETSNITERYTLIEELKSWTEAQQYCREHHTDLVSINSASENEDLVKKAQGKPFWIGLFNNLWKWSHQGDNYTFHNWSNGQQDDYQGKEKCVVMLKDGKWADIDCKSHRSFICFDAYISVVFAEELQVYQEPEVNATVGDRTRLECAFNTSSGQDEQGRVIVHPHTYDSGVYYCEVELLSEGRRTGNGTVLAVYPRSKVERLHEMQKELAKDVPYSLEIAGSNPGYVTADRDREFLGGGAQLAERCPGREGLSRQGNPRLTPHQ